MKLRLKSRIDALVFALGVTAVALAGNAAIELMFLPGPLVQVMLFPASLITVMLALPLSYFVGTKLVAVHDLTVRLEHAADHDLLTGVATRSGFYKRVPACQPPPFAVIVADIDHFKHINDRFGHQGGDTALARFAEILLRNCRADDLVARFGGEEFVILLQGADRAQGIGAANRLCRRVRDTPIVLNDEWIRLTASFGVADLHDIACIDQAIHRADMAVYRAKRDGRNRVCACDPAQAPPPRMRPAAE